MKPILSNNDLDKLAADAQEIAERKNYTESTATAKNHAALQALIVRTNAELTKTIRHLDEKKRKAAAAAFLAVSCRHPRHGSGPFGLNPAF